MELFKLRLSRNRSLYSIFSAGICRTKTASSCNGCRALFSMGGRELNIDIMAATIATLGSLIYGLLILLIRMLEDDNE